MQALLAALLSTLPVILHASTPSAALAPPVGAALLAQESPVVKPCLGREKQMYLSQSQKTEDSVIYLKSL